MEVVLNDVLVCGIRKMGKEDNPYYLLDWYKDAPYTSYVDADKLDAYKTLAGKRVAAKVRIEQRKDKVNYRILEIKPA